MRKKRHTPEEIIRKLREAEVALAQGQTVVQVSRQLGITEQTFYRWRQEFDQSWTRYETGTPLGDIELGLK